ncbi:arsenate reductase ArsC [Desulfovibrio aminophilus]|nr:arsenate reductase ArsC [Desulfovibrio aminophilus]MCM0755179.1 arsenate reductase ArsC [Desulfovibrio aminophilus]
MGKTKVLFICVHNSGRSQMAEAFLNRYGGEEFQVESAGLEPTEINPLVVEVMAEEGIDLAGKKTQSVFDLFRVGRLFDYVITVCDDANEAKCPVFPGVTHRWHWPFPDPSKLSGTREEQLAQLRVIRDQIKDQVLRPFKTPFRTQDTFAS